MGGPDRERLILTLAVTLIVLGVALVAGILVAMWAHTAR